MGSSGAGIAASPPRADAGTLAFLDSLREDPLGLPESLDELLDEARRYMQSGRHDLAELNLRSGPRDRIPWNGFMEHVLFELCRYDLADCYYREALRFS